MGDAAHDAVRAADDGAATALAAWRRYCRRLEELGERLFDDDFPSGAEERIDALEHLAGQVLCWTGWTVFHADPRRPRFQRQNDLITPWGGPNADNVYRHARVDARRRYRIRGRMHACEDFMLAVRAGFMHEPKWGTLFQVAASDLGIGRGDEFELVVGGDDPGEETGSHWIPLPEDAVMVSFREYYWDWDTEEPAVLTIECLDDDVHAPTPRLDGATLAARFDAAGGALGHSIEYWNTYLHEHRAEAVANTFAPLLTFAKGLAVARYRECFWDLADDEVLLIDTDVPPARYWGLQCYDLPTFDLIDPLDRCASLNHRQLVAERDGRVRVVLAPEDPGVANWLDTGGRRQGLLTLRWFWSTGDPSPVTQVVPRAELPDVLPPDAVRVSPAARRAAQAARRAHHGARFRT